jgi:hypothetical protein
VAERLVDPKSLGGRREAGNTQEYEKDPEKWEEEVRKLYR